MTKKPQQTQKQEGEKHEKGIKLMQEMKKNNNNNMTPQQKQPLPGKTTAKNVKTHKGS